MTGINVLRFLTLSVHLSSAVTHILEYNFTLVKHGSHFTADGLLDREQFKYLDNNTAKMTPKMEWIKEVSHYWEKEKKDVEVEQDWLKEKLQDINNFNQVTEGVNTLQRVYGCVIDDENVTRGYDKSIYNGKDFISLNLNTGTWTAVDERAKSFTEDWNPERKTAGFWKAFVEGTCIDRLKNYIPYSTKKEPVTHTLEYRWTVRQENHFTAAGLLDGEEFMSYINPAKMIPKTEWITKVESDSYYLQNETRAEQDWLISKLLALEKANQAEVTEGVNTLQSVYGCEIDDNGVTRGYDKSIYNGKDFISLDLNTGTWTAVDERAKRFTEDWNPEQKSAEYWKNFVEGTCIDRLKSYIPHSTKKEEPGGSEGRSDEGSDVTPDVGSDGGSIAITVVVVLVVLAAVVGFVIYNLKLCARLRSGARQRPEQSPLQGPEPSPLQGPEPSPEP